MRRPATRVQRGSLQPFQRAPIFWDMPEEPPTSAVTALLEQARSGDASKALGIGLRTAKRDWAKAKLRLHREIAAEAV